MAPSHRRLAALHRHVREHQWPAPDAAGASATATPPEHELVVRGGTIVDGTGKPRFVADVGIGRDGKIAAIGPGLGRGAREIDATGKLVTPGFIDVHTHFDAQVCWDPLLAPAPHNGSTTVVFGNCGVGFAPMRKSSASVEYICKLMEGVEEIPTSDLLAGIPAWEEAGGIPVYESIGDEMIPGGFQWETFPEFLDHIEALPHAIDFGANLAYSCVRAYVMGLENAGGTPTEEELAQMKAVVEEAMEHGAMGLCASRSSNHRSAGTPTDGSAGTTTIGMTGDLAPGYFATDAELIEMAKSIAAVRPGKGVFQCISQMTSAARPEGFEDPAMLMRAEDGTHRGMDWMRDIAKLGITVTPTGEFQSSGDYTDAEIESMITTCYRAADEGPGRILPQIGPRSISVNWGIELPLNPFSRHPTFQQLQQEGLGPREIHELLKEPEMKERLMRESEEGLGMRGYIRSAPDLRVLRGEPCEYEIVDQSLKVDGAAASAGMDLWEFAYEELVMKDTIFSLPNNREQTDLDGVLHNMQLPVTRIGLGDSGAHLTSIMDGGYFPFFLVHFCRDRTAGERLDLEAAIKILTADNANLYHLEDRGVLAEGMLADLNVIDFDAMELPQPEVKYDLPAGSRRLHQQPVGIDATIKSGVVIMKHGEQTGEMPGRLLRGPQSSQTGQTEQREDGPTV
jgi:N-acyl-D-amino-acid deacylase